jgi:hypothetical protein
MNLELSDDEALVLFDFLARWEDTGRLAISDQAEQRVLWDVHALLERELTAPLNPDYARLVAEARDRVRDTDA